MIERVCIQALIFASCSPIKVKVKQTALKYSKNPGFFGLFFVCVFVLFFRVGVGVGIKNCFETVLFVFDTLIKQKASSV